MGTALASLTGYGRPVAPPSQVGQVPTYNPDFTFQAFVTAGDVASDGLPGGQTIVGGTVSGDDLTLQGSSAGGGDVFVVGSGIFLDNQKAIWGKNTTGTYRQLLSVNASNQTEIRSAGGGITIVSLDGVTPGSFNISNISFALGTPASTSLRRIGGLANTGVFIDASYPLGVSVGGTGIFAVGAVGGIGNHVALGTTHLAAGTSYTTRDVGLVRDAVGVWRVSNASTGFGQIDFRARNFTTTARPAAGNAGRVIYDSDLLRLILDNGTAWVNVNGESL